MSQKSFEGGPTPNHPVGFDATVGETAFEPISYSISPEELLAAGARRIIIAARRQFTTNGIPAPLADDLKAAERARVAANRRLSPWGWLQNTFTAAEIPELVPEQAGRSLYLCDPHELTITELQAVHWVDGRMPSVWQVSDMSPVPGARQREFGAGQVVRIDPAASVILGASVRFGFNDAKKSDDPLKGDNIAEWGNEIERSVPISESQVIAMQVPFKKYTPADIRAIVGID